ncbi:MAG TPA: NnrS family protein, partial [Dongiaceae bacterium]
MSFVHLVEPQRPPARWPVLALGFRPFFLLAALFAAAAAPVWILIYEGILDPVSYLPPTIWHAHEMIFGFAIAVVSGFLLTASTHWTGWQTASGWKLGLLAGLWIAGRVAMGDGAHLPAWLVVTVDVAFLPIVAVGLAIPILRAGNRRNIAFPVILVVLGGTNLAIHLGALGVIDWDPSRGLRFAIDLILLMIGVLGGRVIPSFTKNALPHARVNPCPKASVLALLSLAALAISDAAIGNPTVTGTLALLAGVVNGLRMRGWGTFSTMRHPILWILHVGYGWMAVGLILRGLADLSGFIPIDAGVHALTLGTIGSMILGMMSRVALGHTGRVITPARLTIAAYWLINAAAFLRVLFA